MIAAPTNLFSALPPGGRERLLEFAREASFPAGERISEEGRRTDRFWVIRTGSVTLDMRIPGRRPVVVETLSHGDLLGWSWLFPPYTWHLGAEALSPVRALEFDAAKVRELCEADAVLGRAIAVRVAEIVAHRLQNARTRLLDLYAPYGSGPLP
ncbi:cyclic nucleotide-binding domain-containing protein [Streptomyces sp. TRM43335]|uniref:Cyclic nucleotide-binding domain-containing protein n=1 Tax=Streptomyces taklimakanensis TaxID=2569853 RepID=A0A6G2B7B4_9ACTN|nr:cyclic nucleotide-binding domain-containing protein [Streptomyces taklimakanensis]MTE17959.1 cyclic nucleotide-binding domain-containing protein [Streptomyces taklimakanensis]